MLYLPRGWVHEAGTSDEASLHLTLGVHVFRWVDLVCEAVKLAAHDNEELRKSLPVRFLAKDGGALRAQLRSLLATVAASPDCQAATWRIGQRLLSNGQPLPDGHFVSISRSPALDRDSVVARRPGMLCRVMSASEGASIHFTGNVISGPRIHRARPQVHSGHRTVRGPRLARLPGG